MPLNRAVDKLTTGTINPGVIWSGQYFQLGIEAMIPVNSESGHNVGVIAQVHFYLDDLCPRFLVNIFLVDKPMKFLKKLLVTECTLLLLIQGSWAHAFVDHTEPAVGSQIHSVPTQVKIWFTEKLEPALSKIQVFDNSGREVDRRDVKIDQSNAALLTVSLLELKPGNYKVVWRAISVDTHVTTGSFTFEIL